MKRTDPVYEFALRIARALKESKSSTALFFVQQAYPDDVDSPAEGCDAILDNVIALAAIGMPTETEVSADLDASLERARKLREFTDDITRAWQGHRDANKIVGSTVGMAVKHFLSRPDNHGEMYWEDAEAGIWAHAPYSWCDRVVVLRGDRFTDDLTRAEFAAKYPRMARIPDDPRTRYELERSRT